MSRTVNLLTELAKNAAAFASTYSALAEALIREGVDERTARDEAGKYAYMAAVAGEYQRPDRTEPWDV